VCGFVRGALRYAIKGKRKVTRCVNAAPEAGERESERRRRSRVPNEARTKGKRRKRTGWLTKKGIVKDIAGLKGGATPLATLQTCFHDAGKKEGVRGLGPVATCP